MSAISNFLTFLRSAIYAIDVRDGIADAIEQCYNDVNNPTLKTEALEVALQTKIDEGEMAALTIGDGTITAAKLASGVIDNTLTTSGAAADAEKTGDEIAAVKADLISVSATHATIIESTSENPVDLDDYTAAGEYKVMSSSVASTIIHSPTQLMGYRLIVLTTTATAKITQIALLDSGGSGSKISVRNKAGSAWTNWFDLASKTSILSVLASDATTIANGTDLDTLTIAGNYKATSAADAQSLSHCPTTVAFAMKVVQLSQTARLMQILYAQGLKMPIYKRYYDGSAWHDWEKEAVDSEQTLLSNVIITSSNLTTYFPNSSFSDAKPNTIYGISDSNLLSDGPVGDEWTGTADRTPGGIRGTLYTLSQTSSHDATVTGLTQIFVGWRNTSYSPTFSYRIATYSNGAYSWSNWSKFEQNGYVHASNIIVYGGSLDKSFTDMNDMPSNTIYQLDLNLNGSDADHTLGHHPAPGVSCVAMCYAFSYTSQHGKVQTVYTIDGRLYWRYGYFQAPGDYRWTSWNQVVSDAGDYLRNKGRLANGTDLNTIKENAIYMLGGQSGANYVNNPITSGAGYLTAKHNSDVTLQIVESLSGTRYSRYTDDGTTWSNWV